MLKSIKHVKSLLDISNNNFIEENSINYSKIVINKKQVKLKKNKIIRNNLLKNFSVNVKSFKKQLKIGKQPKIIKKQIIFKPKKINFNDNYFKYKNINKSNIFKVNKQKSNIIKLYSNRPKLSITKYDIWNKYFIIN